MKKKKRKDDQATQEVLRLTTKKSTKLTLTAI